MTQHSKLYNHSQTQTFGLANGRRLWPLSSIEIVTPEDIIEAEKVVEMFPGTLSFEKKENVNLETINGINHELKLKNDKIAELEKALIEAKAGKEEVLSEGSFIAGLKEEAKSLGIAIKGNPSAETLQAKIAEAKAGKEESSQF